jgi:hypothetical protein
MCPTGGNNWSNAYQVWRVIVSTPADITGEFKEYHLKKRRQFLSVVMGPATGLGTKLSFAERLGFFLRIGSRLFLPG